MLCWVNYGETDELNGTPENPVKLSCPHWIGCNCFHRLVNNKRGPDYRFDNRCPKCRRELFQSEVDERVYTLRDDIMQTRERLNFRTVNARETFLSRESITNVLCKFDAIINQGARIGDIYDQEGNSSREKFNGALVIRWFYCAMESHLDCFMDTMSERATNGMVDLASKHDLCHFAEANSMATNSYVETFIWIEDGQDDTTMPAAYTPIYDLFFGNEEAHTGRPSSHPHVIHHSMMPSQLFLKTLALMQRQITEAQLTGDEWDLLQLDEGDESHVQYKKFCLLIAMEVAAHAIQNTGVEGLQGGQV